MFLKILIWGLKCEQWNRESERVDFHGSTVRMRDPKREPVCRLDSHLFVLKDVLMLKFVVLKLVPKQSLVA